MSIPVSSSTRRGLHPSRTVLPNGAVVTTKVTRKTPAVSISLALRAGSICDPAELPGATHLLGQVIDRGTAQRGAAEIAEALDARGVALSVTVTRHLLSVVFTCLAEDVDFVLTLVGEMVRAPSLPEPELSIRRGEAITSLRQDEDNPAIRAVESLMTLLYGRHHPYGRPVKGTIAAMERATRADLVALHRQRVAPSELSLVVVGDVDVDRIADLTASAFGEWSAPPPAPVELPRAPQSGGRRRLVIPMMNKSQADIAYGFTAITRSDPTYYPFLLMNNILGQYAMGGRLGHSIREQQGMAYYVSSTFDPNIIEGPVIIRAGINAANVERAVTSIDAEVAEIARDGVTERELTESRQYVTGSMPRTLETNTGIAQFLQTAEFFGLGLDYDLRLPELLKGVTREQVQDVAHRYLDPARATLVIAGPYDGD